uniref:Uncharacterized protein n=1 Tax=Anopheles melas TaxID=34690 RepID=A0A182U948_9DIPT
MKLSMNPSLARKRSSALYWMRLAFDLRMAAIITDSDRNGARNDTFDISRAKYLSGVKAVRKIRCSTISKQIGCVLSTRVSISSFSRFSGSATMFSLQIAFCMSMNRSSSTALKMMRKSSSPSDLRLSAISSSFERR